MFSAHVTRTRYTVSFLRTAWRCACLCPHRHRHTAARDRASAPGRGVARSTRDTATRGPVCGADCTDHSLHVQKRRVTRHRSREGHDVVMTPARDVLIPFDSSEVAACPHTVTVIRVQYAAVAAHRSAHGGTRDQPEPAQVVALIRVRAYGALWPPSRAARPY